MSLLLALTASGGPTNYTLTCDAGAYSLSGQDATFTFERKLALDVGVYTYVGNDATLTYVPGAGTINYTLVCDPGAYVIDGGSATLVYVSGAKSENSGGWFPQTRRRTKKEIYRERQRLGILPPDIVKAAAKVAAVAETVTEFRQERPKYEDLFMRELKVTKWSPDYTRAIQIQLELMEQDDEEVLLLMS